MPDWLGDIFVGGRCYVCSPAATDVIAATVVVVAVACAVSRSGKRVCVA